MIDQGSVQALMGSTVRDGSGGKIGKVGQVYLDDTTGLPEWVTVRTGLFGTKESFVPLAAGRVEGDELVIDVTKDQVGNAPRIDEDGHLSEEQEAQLYSYYGISPGAFGRDTGPTDGYPGEHAGPVPDAGTPAPDAGTPAAPADGTVPAADGPEPGEPGEAAGPGRARLRRYVSGPGAGTVPGEPAREEVGREALAELSRDLRPGPDDPRTPDR